jgi:hypothetical protein
MRFSTRIELELPADVILRAPTFWERCKQSLGADVDLSTDRVRERVEAATLLFELRRALERLGVDNARSLIVDGTLVFHDPEGRSGDLPELVLAFSEHISIFGTDFQELQMSVEHEELALHYVMDVRVTAQHRRSEPGVRIEVHARPLEIEPRSGESADDYRQRVMPHVHDKSLLEGARLQFDAFTARLEATLARLLPGATLELAPLATGSSVSAIVEAAPKPTPKIEPARASAEPSAHQKVARAHGAAPRHDAGNTAAPARNFTIATEERIAAAMTGAPPFAVRKRRIEDLYQALRETLADAETKRVDDTLDDAGQNERTRRALSQKLQQINALIDDHNRYYPMERNLPIDVHTGQILEGAEPWRPLPRVTMESLRADALQDRMAERRHG